MIERKTYHADIDRLRPRIFVAAACAIILLFVAIANIRIRLSPDNIINSMIEDIAIDIKLPPLPEQDKNIIAAEVTETQTSSKITLVEQTQQLKQQALADQIEFNTLEADNIEEMQEHETMPASPIPSNDGNAPLRIVEELPEFPGGMTEFVKWLTNALRYPQRSKQLKQQGTVVVSFVIEKDGSATNINFVKQTHTALDAEVLRVLRIMPKWTPAKQHGKPCRAVIAVPFVFAM